MFNGQYNSAQLAQPRLLPHDQRQEFVNIPFTAISAVYMPQPIYAPPTQRDWDQYITWAELENKIVFYGLDGQPGIALTDALNGATDGLMHAETEVMSGCGLCVTIRIHVPGYNAWGKQIATRDFKGTRNPIKLKKLAKEVAKKVKNCLEDKQSEIQLYVPGWPWSVSHVTVEDLVLDSLHNVSKGSWQPHLRLRDPSKFLPLALFNP